MKKILLIGLLFITACSSQSEQSAPTPEAIATEIQVDETQTEEAAAIPLTITSEAFEEGAAIPSDFSCDGNNTSPILTWTEPPSGTQSFALIMDDPDAPVGTFVHWVIFNIPGSARDLSESIPTEPQLSDNSIQGKNSASRTGYMGPCPPPGTHRYFFKLYALDTVLDLTSDAKKDDLLNAMDGHILAEGELMGTYSH